MKIAIVSDVDAALFAPSILDELIQRQATTVATIEMVLMSIFSQLILGDHLAVFVLKRLFFAHFILSLLEIRKRSKNM